MPDYELVDIELDFGDVLLYLQDNEKNDEDPSHRAKVRFTREHILALLSNHVFSLLSKGIKKTEPY